MLKCRVPDTCLNHKVCNTYKYTLCICASYHRRTYDMYIIVRNMHHCQWALYCKAAM